MCVYVHVCVCVQCREKQSMTFVSARGVNSDKDTRFVAQQFYKSCV